MKLTLKRASELMAAEMFSAGVKEFSDPDCPELTYLLDYSCYFAASMYTESFRKAYSRAMAATEKKLAKLWKEG